MLEMVASGAMPRTTFDLDPSVLAQLRRRATHEGKSMGQLASELLAQQLAIEDPASRSQALEWTSRDLGVPRVDLEDKEALHALLDREA
jgi:plasmid stability protein